MAAPDESNSSSAPEFEVQQHTISQIVARLWPLIRPHRYRLLLGCAMVSVAGGLYGLLPLWSRALFDRAIPQRNFTLALVFAGGFVVTHLVRMTIWYQAMRRILYTQEQITFALRSLSFGHLQRLSLKFHSKYPSGFLYQSIFGTAINSVGGCMQTVIKQLSLYLTAIATSLIACLWISPPMTMLILAGSCVYVALARYASPRIYQRSRASHEAQNQITDFIVDRLRGAKTIQSLVLEDRVQTEFESRLWPTQMKSLRAVREIFRLSMLTEGTGYLVTSAIMALGAWLIFNSESNPNTKLTPGDLVAFMAYQATFITIVSVITGIYGEFSSARAGMDRLLTLLSTPSNIVDKADAALPETVRGDLSFEQVTFGYDPTRPVIQALDLTVPAGQTIALVGGSGGGKTTITNLLLRFYDPDRGRIRLDGTDIRDLPLKGYRSLFGVVLQDPYLFNESIANNLRHAAPDATDDELAAALEQAQAWDFVRQLADGLDHVVGESGGGLSGGQRQRIAIARCLLLRARFVILDEPTAALDVESEHAIQRAMIQLFRDRTVFIIAHRLSTVRRADRILVLRNGRIVQDGPYQRLAEEPGPFRRMHELATGKGDFLAIEPLT